MKRAGILRKNDCKRWEIQQVDGPRCEVTSGDVIEVIVAGAWVRTRVEHNGVDYYACVPGVKLYDGMLAREIER